ncbi:MAG TPA: pseudouridine synthase [Leadbetterella sp.]|nr:pseudouridine synthase [Leadbetterella sp.]
MRKRTTEGRASDRDTSKSSFGKPEFKRKEGGFSPDKRNFDKPFAKKEGFSKTGGTSDKFPKREFKPNTYGKPEDNRFPKRDFKSSTYGKPEGASERFTKRDVENLGNSYSDRKSPRKDFRADTSKSSDRFPKKDFKPNTNRFSEERPSDGRFPKREDKYGKPEGRTEGFPKREFNRGSFDKNSDRPNFERKAFDRNTEASKPEARKSNYGNPKNEKAAFRPNYDESSLKSKLPPKVRTKVEKEETFTATIRLNRYLANAGLCSRRDADEFIASGQITVNGEVITEMGYQVKPTDVIKYGRKILNREKLVYVLLNKPKDFLTTTDDPEGRKTVMDLVQKACPERIYPVGRLDRATTGLLLMTNDGELAEKLSHPSNAMRKIYQAELDKKITQEDFDKILEGVELEDGLIKADDLSVITPDRQVVGIEIHSGKNRIVRRIFEHLGYEVTKLDRTTYAGLTKKDLPRGNWRFLTEKEVIRLKYLI